MRALNTVYAAALEDSVTYRHDCPDNGWLAGQLGKEWVILLVAELDARIVGGPTAYELPKLEAARSEIYLYDLAVVETYRRRGIATSLIKEVQHIVAETGA
ncbi:GNAT family N-acetyltransferase [Sphingopyxis sp.]|uniref:GNAT family N-acetyltransferase n=1 Tax=Sphingopyxis sp. TaxID=1908224 RepID=UPI0025DCCFDA|nr:GNAT family N-acetyltransferase [Sphingopyxis sp.]